MTYKALCQDCLRAVTFKTEQGFDAAQANEVSCICNGDLCGCEGCMTTLSELEAGNLCNMVSWTADGGAVGITARNFQLEAYASVNRWAGKTVAIKELAERLGIKNVYVSKRTTTPENTGRLLLTRRPGESVRVGDSTTVSVVHVYGRRCDLVVITDGNQSDYYGISASVSFFAIPGALVRVVSIQGAQVRLAFEADRSINIVRTELL